jgi:hypothetical protein
MNHRMWPHRPHTWFTAFSPANLIPKTASPNAAAAADRLRKRSCPQTGTGDAVFTARGFHDANGLVAASPAGCPL